MWVLSTTAAAAIVAAAAGRRQQYRVSLVSTYVVARAAARTYEVEPLSERRHDVTTLVASI